MCQAIDLVNSDSMQKWIHMHQVQFAFTADCVVAVLEC